MNEASVIEWFDSRFGKCTCRKGLLCVSCRKVLASMKPSNAVDGFTYRKE